MLIPFFKSFFKNQINFKSILKIKFEALKPPKNKKIKNL